MNIKKYILLFFVLIGSFLITTAQSNLDLNFKIWLGDSPFNTSTSNLGNYEFDNMNMNNRNGYSTQNFLSLNNNSCGVLELADNQILSIKNLCMQNGENHNFIAGSQYFYDEIEVSVFDSSTNQVTPLALINNVTLTSYPNINFDNWDYNEVIQVVLPSNINTSTSVLLFSMHLFYGSNTPIGNDYFMKIALERDYNGNLNLGDDINICQGDDLVDLDITGQIDGYTSLTWYLNNTVVQNGGEIFSPNISGTYTIEAEYPSGCIYSSSMSFSYEGCCGIFPDLGDDILVSGGNDWPLLSFTGNFPNMVSMFWTDGEFTMDNAANFQTTHTGEYSVTVTYVNGNGTTCTTSDSIIVAEGLFCNNNVDLGRDIVISQGESWPVLSINRQMRGSRIFWRHNGIAYPRSNNSSTFQTFEPGTYSVEVRYGSKYNCVTTDSIVIKLKDKRNKKHYTIYPNPAKDRVTLNFIEFNNTEKFMITIYDFFGKIVFNKETNLSSLNIDTKSWISGIYTCKVHSGNEITIKKIIKK